MNNPTSNKKSSQSSKSIKQSHRVKAQLARREKGKSEVVLETVTAPTSAIEIIPTCTLPPVEKVHLVEPETAEPAEIVPCFSSSLILCTFSESPDSSSTNA